MRKTNTENRQLVPNSKLPPAIPDLKLPRELQSTIRKLSQLAKKQRTDFLLANYEIGQIAKKALDDHHAKHGTLHGHHVADRVAEEAGMSSRLLRYCVNLVEAFSADEYHKLILRPQMTWSHILQLIAVDSVEKRSTLIERAETENWTPDQLRDAISNESPKHRMSAGRLPSVPRGVNHALLRLHSTCQKAGNFLKLSCFGEKFDLAEALYNSSPDDIDHDVRCKALQSVAELDALSELARRNADRLRQKLPWLNEVIVAKQREAGSLDVPVVDIKTPAPKRSRPQGFLAAPKATPDPIS